MGSSTPAGTPGPASTTRGCVRSAGAAGVQATRLTFDSDYETVLVDQGPPDRLDAAIDAMAADGEFTPVVRRLGCLRGVSTLTGFALAVEIGDWHRFTGDTIGSFVGLVPSEYSSGASRVRDRSPRPATPTYVGCSSKLPGTTAPATWSARPCATGGSWPPRPPEPAATRATVGFTNGGSGSTSARKKTTIANVAIARELAGWCWSLAVLEE